MSMKFVEGRLPGPAPHWRLPEVFWVARYDYQPGWAFDSHAHDFFQLIYVIDGAGTAEIDGLSIDLHPAICLFMPPYANHSLKNDRDIKLRTIDLKFDVHVKELGAFLRQFKGSLDDTEGAIRGLLEELHHEAVMGAAWHCELCCTLLMYILILVARKTKSDDDESAARLTHSYPSDVAIRELMSYIHQNYANADLNLADLVQVVGHSKSYLEKKFRRVIGLSIHRYIRRYRVYQAKELLRYSEYPIKEIAGLTGFKTVHHFTRVFADITGMPPAKWRAFELRTGRKGIVLSPRFYNVDITNT